MQSSFSELEYAAKKRLTRRDRFLAEIESVTPWSSLLNVIAAHYPSSGGRGRPPVGLERMLRMYVAQQCFGLSDEATEDALYDSQASHLLEAHQLTESIFKAINAHLAEKGLFLREGTIVDATMIAAPPSTKNKEGKRDAEMDRSAVGELIEKLEQAKASFRAKVEHQFHVVKNLFQHRKGRYKGLAKNTAQLLSLFGFANLMLARRWLVSAHSQVVS